MGSTAVMHRAIAPCLVGLLVAGISPPAQAQQLTPGTLPIEVRALPSRVTAGSLVTISGTSALVGNGKPVVIRVTGPSAASGATLNAPPTGTGVFTASFTKTVAIGHYTVRATAPDGKAMATASFDVVPPGEIPTAVARLADSLVMLASSVTKKVDQGLAALPPSPARDESRKRVQAAAAKLAQLPASVAVLKDQVGKVFDARSKVAKPIKEWDEYVGTLDSWKASAQQARQKLEDRAAATAAGAEACADLDSYSEVLTYASEAINLVKAPFDYAESFLGDKIPGGLVSRSGADGITPPERFALTQSMKLAWATLRGPSSVATAAPGLLLDAAQFLLQAGIAKYCERWEGPLTGRFLGESFTKAGEPFFDYTIDLDGKLTLMYPKGAPLGAAVKLVGYIDGSGSFKVRDNPKPVARLIPGQVLFHRVTSPPGAPYVDEVGQVNRGAMPWGFRIPVTGIMAGDSILLTLGAATFDFSEAIQGMSTWVVMPAGGLVPQVLSAAIPLQKAHPIIERVIRRRPVLRIVSSSGATMTARGTFARDTSAADKTARVRTTLEIKACNPGCLPLPLSPAKDD